MIIPNTNAKKLIIPIIAVGLTASLQIFSSYLHVNALYIVYIPAIIFCFYYGSGILSIMLASLSVHFVARYHLNLSHHSLITSHILFLISCGAVYTLMVDRDRAYREMSRYVKVRDNFFSMVSHELKTPMTTLKLKNQMQLRKLDPESSIFKSLNENVNLVNKMNRVISDMLDMSLIKSGNLHMDKRNFNISEIVNLSVVNSKSNLPSNRQILFKNQNPNIYAIVDAERIVHVLESLIRNAEQHGEGLITVSVTESVYSVKILVKDQGIISDLLRKKIFKKYELADVGHGGLGLGMYIAQKVIRAHQGWFYLEDCLNTSFCIEIPKITTN